MLEVLIQMLFGWPAMILALVCALSGILLKKVSLALIGAILFLAPAWYLSNYSVFFGSLPFFLLLAAEAIAKNKIGLSILSVIPVVVVMGILGYVVLNQ